MSNGREVPLASHTGVPHTVPSGATVHDAFPPFFPNPKKFLSGRAKSLVPRGRGMKKEKEESRPKSIFGLNFLRASICGITAVFTEVWKATGHVFPQNLFPCTVLPCKYITTWYIFLKWGNMGQYFRLGIKILCTHLKKKSISRAMPGSCGP